MKNKVPLIALTPGEPAGIGPDIVLQTIDQFTDACLIVIADPDCLQQRAQQLGFDTNLPLLDTKKWNPETLKPGAYILPVELNTPVKTGILNRDNAAYVLKTLDLAIDGCMRGSFDALVTGPVHKANINEAGFPFSGHTEYLAQQSNTERVVMMLTTNDSSNNLRVALATTHLPLSQVSQEISKQSLRQILIILDNGLRKRFKLTNPRISVCGLNPHAGEKGHMGREEIDVIAPVINELQAQGFDLQGPIPADTAFNSEALKKCDAVLAMYHDQGLPVLKYASFGNAVNITLGLPFIRTSVDHGTALQLAGTGKAATGSLVAAIKLAIQLARS